MIWACHSSKHKHPYVSLQVWISSLLHQFGFYILTNAANNINGINEAQYNDKEDLCFQINIQVKSQGLYLSTKQEKNFKSEGTSNYFK